MTTDVGAQNMPNEMKNKEKWYGDAKDYWKDIPATDNGMLGGFAHISTIDIAGSKEFLQEFLEPQIKRQKKEDLIIKTQSRIALDCGAGIGRVTKNLLIPLFETVDMLEQNRIFLDQCDQYLGDKRSQVENLFPIGLQEFDPEPNRYDVIWCQWVMGHLTDDDFIAFLNRCKKGLAEGGIVCIKENIAAKQHYVVDEVDSSVTRQTIVLLTNGSINTCLNMIIFKSHNQYLELFKDSGMKVLRKETQTDFPSEIFKVNMYALVAESTTDENKNADVMD